MRSSKRDVGAGWARRHITVATAVMLNPGPLVPQDEFQRDFSGLNVRFCNRPGITIDFWNGLEILKMIGKLYLACTGSAPCIAKSKKHPFCQLFAQTNQLTQERVKGSENICLGLALDSL